MKVRHSLTPAPNTPQTVPVGNGDTQDHPTSIAVPAKPMTLWEQSSISITFPVAGAVHSGAPPRLFGTEVYLGPGEFGTIAPFGARISAATVNRPLRKVISYFSRRCAGGCYRLQTAMGLLFDPCGSVQEHVHQSQHGPLHSEMEIPDRRPARPRPPVWADHRRCNTPQSHCPRGSVRT